MELTPRNPFRFFVYYAFLVVFMIIALAMAANAQQTWLRVEQGSGVPTFNPNSPAPKQGYVYKDTLTNNWSIWISGTSWKPSTIFSGTDGKTPVLQTGTTTTTASGTPANLQLRIVSPNTYAVDAWIPQGKDGTNGSGSIPEIVSIDSYGANHVSGSTKDADAWQNAIANGSGKTIYCSGVYYWNHAVVIPKYLDVRIEGVCTIYLQGSWTGAAFQRANPTDLNDAIKYMNYHEEFHNITISCDNKNQSGFDIKAGSNILYDHCTIVGANWGFRSEFQLLATYNECTVLESNNGFYIGIGTFTGATINNAQSNCTRLFKPHCASVSGIGIYVDASYEVMMDQVAIEGNGTCQYGVYYNMQNSNTSKNGSINFFHGEQVGGATGAWIYVSMGNGTISIDNVICHYAGLVVDAQSSNSTGVVSMSYMNYAVGDASGKYFNSHGSMNFTFYDCYSFYPSVVSSRFVSPAPTYCSGYTISGTPATLSWSGCSGNTFQLTTSR